MVLLSSGDPDELTLRAARLLGEADVVLHDRSVPAVILDRARADAVRLPFAEGGARDDQPGLTVILTLAPPT